MAGSENGRMATFNLKAVVNRTGLKPDTLRAWERRYGLPQPQRSAGGHRLYSDRDIDIVKWLVARQAEGLSIGNAVDLWTRLRSEGKDPLQMREYAPAGSGAVPTTAPVTGNTIDALREAWIAASEDFDERSAEQLLVQAFARFPSETVVLEVLQKGITEIGETWNRGEITVQQELFASEMARRRIQALIAASAPPTLDARILAAAPPDEEHDFGLLILAFLLRQRGWNLLYLGANVPTIQLGNALESAKPQLVVSVAQQLHTAAALREMGLVLHAQGVPLAFGGTIFSIIPDLPPRIPGHFMGDSLEVAPQIVEQILSHPRPTPTIERVSETNSQALDHFRERLPEVESQIWGAIGQGDISQSVYQANERFARDIMAALSLGDISLLGTEAAWIVDLLLSYGMPPGLVNVYLSAYGEAVLTGLERPGAPIQDWMTGLKGQS